MRKRKTKFTQWLEEQYVKWQASIGRRVQLDEFAEYLGISRPLLSHYMNGVRRPSAATVKKLADTLGADIYDALEMPKTDKLDAIWDDLTEEEKSQLIELGQGILAKRKGHAK